LPSFLCNLFASSFKKSKTDLFSSNLIFLEISSSPANSDLNNLSNANLGSVSFAAGVDSDLHEIELE